MAVHPGQPLVIYGYSQGAIVANLERRKLAELYPEGTPAPDIDFVLSGDPNTPNGGLSARFPGLYIPILDFTFNGPAPTDTQFDTVVINREYEGVERLPAVSAQPALHSELTSRRGLRAFPRSRSGSACR